MDIDQDTEMPAPNTFSDSEKKKKKKKKKTRQVAAKVLNHDTESDCRNIK